MQFRLNDRDIYYFLRVSSWAMHYELVQDNDNERLLSFSERDGIIFINNFRIGTGYLFLSSTGPWGNIYMGGERGRQFRRGF